MNPGQLKETTMDPATRRLIRITLPQEYEERAGVKYLVDRLMGNNPAHRFAFIQENAARLDEEAIDARGAGAARRRGSAARRGGEESVRTDRTRVWPDQQTK